LPANLLQNIKLPFLELYDWKQVLSFMLPAI